MSHSQNTELGSQIPFLDSLESETELKKNDGFVEPIMNSLNHNISEVIHFGNEHVNERYCYQEQNYADI